MTLQIPSVRSRSSAEPGSSTSARRSSSRKADALDGRSPGAGRGVCVIGESARLNKQTPGADRSVVSLSLRIRGGPD